MALLFVIVFGVLLLALIAWFALSLREMGEAAQQRHARFARDLRAVWVGAVLFWLAWMSGAVGATLLFGIVSFLALREFITLMHTRRGDHRGLILAFFVVLPLQFVLAGGRWFDLFTVFIPVYVFLAIPVVSALAGDPGALSRAQRQDPVGHHGVRVRPEPRARAAVARVPQLRGTRSVPVVLPGGGERERADRAGGGQPPAARAARRAPHRPQLLRARLVARRRSPPA